MKVAVCLVDIIDDNASENHCVSNCSSAKPVSYSNLSQYILTMIVGGSLGFIPFWSLTLFYAKTRFCRLLSIAEFTGLINATNDDLIKLLCSLLNLTSMANYSAKKCFEFSNADL